MEVNSTELERQFSVLSVGLNSFVFQTIGSMAQAIKDRDEYIKTQNDQIKQLNEKIQSLETLNAPGPVENPLKDK